MTTAFVFDLEPRSLEIAGETRRFPVGRIFCVGRNYVEHAKEMDAPAEPIFFMKPATAATNDRAVRRPASTERFDHEVELVLALGAAGSPTSPSEARALIYAAGVGVDLTRRDVQARAKVAGEPWETAKAFDASAPVGPLAKLGPAIELDRGAISLSINGARRQSGDLAEMTLGVEALLIALALTWRLLPGDLVFTGTPAGVGPLEVGDRIDAAIAGLPPLQFELV